MTRPDEIESQLRAICAEELRLALATGIDNLGNEWLEAVAGEIAADILRNFNVTAKYPHTPRRSQWRSND